MHPLADIIKTEISNLTENDNYNKFSFSNKYFSKHRCYNCNRKLKDEKLVVGAKPQHDIKETTERSSVIKPKQSFGETTYKFDKYGFDIHLCVSCINETLN